jgi:hypothetical protein
MPVRLKANEFVETEAILSGQKSDRHVVAWFPLRWPKNEFHQVQRQLEQVLSELKLLKDPERRRLLLREMSRLLAEGQIKVPSDAGTEIGSINPPQLGLPDTFAAFAGSGVMKPRTACFNCESTSSAMAITSSKTVLKSTLPRLL